MEGGFEEGVEYSLEDPSRWVELAPVRGQVIEIPLDLAGYPVEPDIWGAFLVVQVASRVDGSLVLHCRCLGCEDPDLQDSLFSEFNDEGNAIHLCFTSPCLPAEEREGYVHVTRVRLWSLSFFRDLKGYVNKDMFKKTAGWLKAKDSKAGPTTKGKAGPGAEKTARKPPKEKRKTPKETPAGKRPKKDHKEKNEEEKREKLRKRLKETRERLQGSAAGAPPKRATPKKTSEEIAAGEEEAEQVSSSSYLEEEEPSDFAAGEKTKPAIQDRLSTGTHLEAGTSILKNKGRTQKDDSSRTKLLKDSLVDINTTGSKSTSKQLLTQALVASQIAKKRKSTHPGSKKTGVAKLTEALTELISHRASKGKDASERKRKKKKKKKKRRKLVDGTIVSYSESSEDGSDEIEEEEEKEESDTDLEAPLRKKSRGKPGSVLSLLVRHVQEQMNQSAMTDILEQDDQVTGGVKVLSFFNMFIKASYTLSI